MSRATPRPFEPRPMGSAGLTHYWLAHYVDWSSWRVFISELDCLRFAVAAEMSVKRVKFGDDPKKECSA
jgi:hypothetical protein